MNISLPKIARGSNNTTNQVTRDSYGVGEGADAWRVGFVGGVLLFWCVPFQFLCLCFNI